MKAFGKAGDFSKCVKQRDNCLKYGSHVLKFQTGSRLVQSLEKHFYDYFQVREEERK